MAGPSAGTRDAATQPDIKGALARFRQFIGNDLMVHSAPRLRGALRVCTATGGTARTELLRSIKKTSTEPNTGPSDCRAEDSGGITASLP